MQIETTNEKETTTEKETNTRWQKGQQEPTDRGNRANSQNASRECVGLRTDEEQDSLRKTERETDIGNKNGSYLEAGYRGKEKGTS